MSPPVISCRFLKRTFDGSASEASTHEVVSRRIVANQG